jgi:hypothetical protein
VLVIFLVGFIELKMGRLLICKCGHIRFWVGKVASAENSQQIADWYSFSHIIHGFIFYALLRWIGRGKWSLGFCLLLAILIESSWEIVENTPYVINYYRSQTASLGYTGDTVLNSMCDIGCAIIGFFIARYSAVWVTIALVIAMEAICAICIRDNLLLNIVMLIHPFEFIKHWQMGG